MSNESKQKQSIQLQKSYYNNQKDLVCKNDEYANNVEDIENIENKDISNLNYFNKSSNYSNSKNTLLASSLKSDEHVINKDGKNTEETVVFIIPKLTKLDFINPTDDLEEFHCNLCQGILIDPVIDNCEDSHAFCRSCIKDNLIFKDKGKCPISTNECSNYSFNKASILSKILNKKMIRCINNRPTANLIKNSDDTNDYSKNNKNNDQCNWTGVLNNLFKHLNEECSDQLVKCLNIKCEKEIKRKYYNTHFYKECDYRRIPCKDCNTIYHFCEKSEHIQLCENELIECSNNCGMKVKRKEMKQHINDFCDKKIVFCEYSKFGCLNKLYKRDLNEHNKNNFEYHNSLISNDNQTHDHDNSKQANMNSKKILEAYINDKDKSVYLKDDNNTKINISNIDNFFTRLEKLESSHNMLLSMLNNNNKYENTMNKECEVLYLGNKRENDFICDDKNIEVSKQENYANNVIVSEIINNNDLDLKELNLETVIYNKANDIDNDSDNKKDILNDNNNNISFLSFKNIPKKQDVEIKEINNIGTEIILNDDKQVNTSISSSKIAITNKNIKEMRNAGIIYNQITDINENISIRDRIIPISELSNINMNSFPYLLDFNKILHNYTILGNSVSIKSIVNIKDPNEITNNNDVNDIHILPFKELYNNINLEISIKINNDNDNSFIGVGFFNKNQFDKDSESLNIKSYTTSIDYLENNNKSFYVIANTGKKYCFNSNKTYNNTGFGINDIIHFKLEYNKKRILYKLSNDVQFIRLPIHFENESDNNKIITCLLYKEENSNFSFTLEKVMLKN